MSNTEGEEMDGVERVVLSEDEKRVLDIYDQLEALQLEIALLKSQGILSHNELPEAEPQSVEHVQDEIAQAERALLESKATYNVRKKVVEQTLIANPIVEAVHGSTRASAAEQDLLPLIHERDASSIKLANLSTDILKAREDLRQIESENMIINKENAELSSRMIVLAGEANQHKKEEITDMRLRQQLDKLESEVKGSRQKWRIMKSTASATIVGSGVNWARDPSLLKIVLDDEDVG